MALEDLMAKRMVEIPVVVAIVDVVMVEIILVATTTADPTMVTLEDLVDQMVETTLEVLMVETFHKIEEEIMATKVKNSTDVVHHQPPMVRSRVLLHPILDRTRKAHQDVPLVHHHRPHHKGQDSTNARLHQAHQGGAPHHHPKRCRAGTNHKSKSHQRIWSTVMEPIVVDVTETRTSTMKT